MTGEGKQNTDGLTADDDASASKREPGRGMAEQDAKGDSDAADTMDAVSASNRPREPGSLPFQRWDRYRIVGHLGTGGMGSVYKALDLRLDRLVALKFPRLAQLDAHDLRMVRRFKREALAQARIEHPNICKIYEVGEVEGSPYLAMQLIDGVQLSEAYRSMSPEDKLRIMLQVADALHAAHLAGVIHRDIKPANIMIETKEGGTLFPYLMDFGLARDLDANGQSTTAGIAGTPAFMAPEQATANNRLLDHRADIYSFGAAFYYILVGRPPFMGTAADILVHVANSDPIELRSINATIPKDLETIVIKCMEKDPQRRYDSAKELASDLSRLLEGSQIGAKPPSLRHRLGKLARRNKIVVASIGAALLASLILGSFALRARFQAAAQARLSQELAQVIKEVELFMQVAYGLPNHDIRREQAIVRQRMAQMRSRLQAANTATIGAMRYAIGRGHLVLREYPDAQAELERGWHAGYRTAEARLALGLTLGERYRQELEQARRVPDRKWLEAHEKELEARYLKPAVAYLEGAQSPIDAPALIEGLLALYRKQYDVALVKARQAQAQAPWLAAPLKLEGDVYQEQAIEYMTRGEYKTAVSKLKEAVDRHHTAGLTGSSDSAIHEAEAADWLWILATKEHTGEAIGETAERATAACAQAIQANPTMASVYQIQASVYWRSAILALNLNQDAVSLLGKSIAASQKAVELAPENWLSHYGVGIASTLLIHQQVHESVLDAKIVANATAALGTAVRLNPNAHWAWNDLATVYMWRMIYEMQRGAFKKELYEEFIAGAEKAVQLRPDDATQSFATLSYGSGLVAAFHLDSGLQPERYIAGTIDYAERGQAINSADMNHLNNETTGHLIAATFQILRGEDSKAELDTSERLIQRSLTLNPTYSETHQMATQIQYLRAWAALRAGRKPKDEVASGLAAAARGEAVSKDDATLLMYKARILSVSGRALRDETAMGQARAEAARAVTLTPKLPEAHEIKCEILRHSAALRLGKPALSTKDRAEGTMWIQEGLSACESALALNPRRALAQGHHGALRLLQARESRDEVQRRSQAAAALQDLKKALELNRWLDSEFAPPIADANSLQSPLP